MKKQVNYVKMQRNWLRAHAVWLLCLFVGLVGILEAFADYCLYDEQPGYHMCLTDGDCTSWTDPQARQCPQVNYGVMALGQTVTNTVSQSTYQGGTCGDYEKCKPGTLVSQTPNVKLIETPCSECPNG